MKRIFSLCLLIVFISTIIPTYGFAVNEEAVIVSFFEDCSYLVETIVEMQSRASGSKAGTKSTTYYSQDGTAQ